MYNNTYNVPYSVLGKRPLPGKHPCTLFQGVYEAASIQIIMDTMSEVSTHDAGQNHNVCTQDTTVCTYAFTTGYFLMWEWNRDKKAFDSKLWAPAQYASALGIGRTLRVEVDHDHISSQVYMK